MWHRIYFHVVWTTRERQPIIDAPYAVFLCRFLRAVARQERVQVLEIGLVATHVHLLIRVHPTTAISNLLQRMKGGSSVIGSRQRRVPGADVRWARGYSITSVGPRAIPRVREYLRSQARRHPTEAIGAWKGDEPDYEDAGAA